MITLKNILVATDFGEPSCAALNYGRALARNFAATLHVLHVADDVMTRIGPELYGIDIDQLQKDIDADAKRRVAALLSEQDRLDLHAVAEVRTSRSPAYEITAYAKQRAIDLIIIGTHGRGGVERLLLGSVAERVVRIAPCPVLTVREREHEFVTPETLVTTTKA